MAQLGFQCPGRWETGVDGVHVGCGEHMLLDTVGVHGFTHAMPIRFVCTYKHNPQSIPGHNARCRSDSKRNIVPNPRSLMEEQASRHL